MLRCALMAATLLAALPTFAQVAPRTFPANALRGEIVVTVPPEITLNGKPARLAPGARILDTQNLLQLSGAVVGQRLVVNYTLDAVGQPQQVWILTTAERAKAPWPSTEEQARTWFFDAAAQAWSRP